MRSFIFTLALPVIMTCSPEYATHSSTTSANACAGKTDHQQTYVKTMPERIVIIGDSEACYMKRVIDKDPKYANVDVYCKGGTTIANWETYGGLQTALLKHKKPIDLIIVALGTNNYWYPELANTKPIEEQIKNIPRCIWVGPTKVDNIKHHHTAMLKDYIIHNSNCEYFDTEEANIPLSDRYHPTSKGTKKWLELIWQSI